MVVPKWTWADTFGGGLIAVFGIGVVVEGCRYPIGTINRMGPGYLPIVMGAVLTGLGLSIVFAGDGGVGTRPKNVRAPAFVFAGLVVWGLLLERAGLIPATAALIALAAFAHPRPDPRRILVTLIVVPLAATALFVYGLGLPIEPFSIF